MQVFNSRDEAIAKAYAECRDYRYVVPIVDTLRALGLIDWVESRKFVRRPLKIGWTIGGGDTTVYPTLEAAEDAARAREAGLAAVEHAVRHPNDVAAEAPIEPLVPRRD